MPIRDLRSRSHLGEFGRYFSLWVFRMLLEGLRDNSEDKKNLSTWETLTLNTTWDFERALRMISDKVLSVRMVTSSIEAEVANWHSLNAFYANNHFRENPESYFVKPTSLPYVSLGASTKLSVGEVVDIRFLSGYQPMYLPFCDDYFLHPENITAHARWWRHPKNSKRGTVIAIHGWMLDDPRLRALTLVPGFFYRLGLDVILFELPLHGSRLPKKLSGASLFPSTNISRTNELMAQAIYDLRSLAAWIQATDRGPVGVLGLSLGAYLGSLWASLDALDFVVSVAPLSSLADALPHLSRLPTSSFAPVLNSLLNQISLEQLREVFAVHTPLCHSPKVPKDKRLIIAGENDSLLPPEQARSLWEHWNRPNIHWLPGNHLEYISRPEGFSLVWDFLRSHGYAHETQLSIVPRRIAG